MSCSRCGQEVQEGVRFCSFCGAEQVVSLEEGKPGLFKWTGMGCGVMIALILIGLLGSIMSTDQAVLLVDPIKGSVEAESIIISGETEVGNRLLVNGMEYPVNERGRFSVEVPLNLGLNEFVVVAMKAEDESSKRERVVRVERTLPSISLELRVVRPLPCW